LNVCVRLHPCYRPRSLLRYTIFSPISDNRCGARVQAPPIRDMTCDVHHRRPS
jgi:hypothetical protein